MNSHMEVARNGEEVHPFAYRFQKHHDEIFETEVDNNGEIESCKEELELDPWNRPDDPLQGLPVLPDTDGAERLVVAEQRASVFKVLNGKDVDDIPAVYAVPTLQPYEFAAVGVWIDKRIVPGFKYRVRSIDCEDYKDDYLFNGNGLTLQSIGCGYSRRITFAPPPGQLNNNGNYFYSDSRLYGFAFQPELVSVGEKYTVYDISHHPVGHLEIIRIQYPQEEISHSVLSDKSVEKSARVRFLAKVEWFDNNEVCVVSVSGSAVSIKKRNCHAQIARIVGVSISGHPRRNYTLYPGIDNKKRCIVVSGASCNDVPVSYSVVGLETYELPVVGTYVDPRILPGFCYKVRPINTKQYLFNGRPLRLMNTGAGYSKRLTFASDKGCLNSNSNYFWTDSHPSGFGFELRAVPCGSEFNIYAENRCIGHASVFRVDNPQYEKTQTVMKSGKGATVTKYVHVDVTCLVTLELSEREKSKICDSRVMGISGTAVLQKSTANKEAKLLRIEDIGLDSQLNVLFFAEHTNLVFEAD